MTNLVERQNGRGGTARRSRTTERSELVSEEAEFHLSGHKNQYALMPKNGRVRVRTYIRYRRGYPGSRANAGFFLTIVISQDNLVISQDNYQGRFMKRVGQIDLDTGEEIGSFVAVIRPKQKSTFQRHFTMNQAALLTIANELNHEQMRVLMALLAELDYENYIQVAQTDISVALQMQKTNVSRAIKNLLEFGIILEGPRIGRSKTYRLNPQFGWKGTVSNHKKALKNGLSVIQGGRAV
ncbi:hypothetical protein ACU6Z3_27775 [Klebsiella aerogenes]